MTGTAPLWQRMWQDPSIDPVLGAQGKFASRYIESRSLPHLWQGRSFPLGRGPEIVCNGAFGLLHDCRADAGHARHDDDGAGGRGTPAIGRLFPYRNHGYVDGGAAAGGIRL